jgi:3-isopropylmalate dehydrogenase
MEVAKKVLEQLSAQAGVEFDFREGHIGLSALEAKGSILPDETIELCKSVDAVLLGGLSGKKLENDVSPRDCEYLVFRYA